MQPRGGVCDTPLSALPAIEARRPSAAPGWGSPATNCPPEAISSVTGRVIQSVGGERHGGRHRRAGRSGVDGRARRGRPRRRPGGEHDRRAPSPRRRLVRRARGDPPQAGRRLAGRHLRRARRDRAGDRARPDRPRHPAGRAGVHPRGDAPGVDIRRSGDHRRRRGGCADLPDQLPRGVPLGDLRLRRLRDRVRERRAARQGRRRARPPAGAAHRDRDRPG